jgi:hypothetical protein
MDIVCGNQSLKKKVGDVDGPEDGDEDSDGDMV